MIELYLADNQLNCIMGSFRSDSLNLKQIDLRGNPITESELKSSGLLDLPTLEKLILTNSSISALKLSWLNNLIHLSILLYDGKIDIDEQSFHRIFKYSDEKIPDETRKDLEEYLTDNSSESKDLYLTDFFTKIFSFD